MASKTGKLILTGAATAALAAGCQTQPLSTTPSMGLGAASSAEYDVLSKKGGKHSDGDRGGSRRDCVEATTCDEARYTVFARSDSEVLHFTGSRNVITGDVHTNDALKMAGNNDQIKGTAEYVDDLTIKGNNNSVSRKDRTGVEPYPFQLDPASFGTPTFDFVGDVNLNDRPEVWQSKGVLKPGVYRATGKITLPTHGASGTVTFLAASVQMPGKNHNLKPFSQGVLIYATGTGNNTVHLSGNSNLFAGLILAPNGAFQMTGNSNSLNGQVYTDAFKISGANNRITYSQYIECPTTTLPSASPTASPTATPPAEATPTPAPTPSGDPIPTPVPTEQPPEPTPTPAGTIAPESPSPGATASPTPVPITEPSMEATFIAKVTDRIGYHEWSPNQAYDIHVRLNLKLPPNSQINRIRFMNQQKAGGWTTNHPETWLVGVEENGVKLNPSGIRDVFGTFSGEHTFDIFMTEAGPDTAMGPFFGTGNFIEVEVYIQDGPTLYRNFYIP